MTHIEPAPTLDLSSFRPAPMPGESPEAFDALYSQLCLELINPSPLTQILTAQLAAAIIWHQRHQKDKQALIINNMVDSVNEYYARDIWRRAFLDTVEGSADSDTKASVEDIVSSKGYTLESLASHATAVAGRQLVGIENLIDRQFKTIRQLQKSIAEVEAKPLIVKRLALQVEQLTRDAQELAHDDTNLETTG